MVIKINSGNSLFGTLAYNEDKVKEGEAKVLCSNRIIQNIDGSHNMYMTLKSFEPYLDANKRTEKPVLHISINPHPDDMLTDKQLDSIAQEYMEKLGYGNQPYLVYKHEDIDRHHIHIVSVRVDENGKKINDSFEKKRSDEIRKELEKKYRLIPAGKKSISGNLPLKPVNLKVGNIKRQVANITKSLMPGYKFQSIYEYRALLSLYNITVEEVKGEVKGKPYNGLVYSVLNSNGEKVGNPFKASLIGRSVGYDALQKHFTISKNDFKEKDLKSRTKNVVSTVLINNPSRKLFEKELLKQGISVLFRENNDKRIYGVTFIDHTQKTVFNGSSLGKEFSANVFHQLFNSKDTVEQHSQENIFNNTYNDTPEGESVSEAVAGIFAMQQHGDNYEEIAFINRKKRKKKKHRRFGL